MRCNEFMPETGCRLRVGVWTERQLEQALENPFIERVYMPIHLAKAYHSMPQNEKNADRIIISPPAFIGSAEQSIKKRLGLLKNRGFNALEVHTLDTLEIGMELGFTLHGSFRLNVTNSTSARVYQELGVKDLTLSIELGITQARHIDGLIPHGIVVYGRLPLTLCRRCPISGGKTCGKPGCGKKLTDRKGNKLGIICDTCCQVLNPHVLNLSDKKSDMAVFDFAVLLFTDESDIDEVVKSFVNGKKPTGQFTRGLYYK